MATINDGLRKILELDDIDRSNLKTRPALVDEFLRAFAFSITGGNTVVIETVSSAVKAQKTIGGKFNAFADKLEELKSAGPDPNPSGTPDVEDGGQQ